MEKVPRIADVRAVGEAELLVRFQNGVEKVYDCRQVVARPEFQLLRTAAFSAPLRSIPAATESRGATTST